MSDNTSTGSPLSKRELEIIALAVEGLTDKEICRKLGITLATIRTHWVRLRVKQGSVNRAQAVATALYAEYAHASVALRESERRYRLIVESAKEYAIFTIDMQGLITSWHAASAEIFGYPKEEIVGQLFDALFTSEDRERGLPQEEMRTALAEGRALDDGWLVRKGGGRMWVTGTLSPFFGEDGAPSGFTKVVRDETARKQVAEILRRTEDRSRDFLENTGDAIVCFEFLEPVPVAMAEDDLIDRLYHGSRLAECNRAMAEVCGYDSPEEMVGMPMAELWLPDDPENRETLREFVRAGYKALDAPSHEWDKQGNVREFDNDMRGTVEERQLVRLWLVQKPVPPPN